MTVIVTMSVKGLKGYLAAFPEESMGCVVAIQRNHELSIISVDAGQGRGKNIIIVTCLTKYWISSTSSRRDSNELQSIFIVGQPYHAASAPAALN
jgi:hypothetical protein